MAGHVYPEPGSKLDITLYTLNKNGVNEGIKELPVGEFEVDEIEINGMPTTVQIKAVNAIADTSLRGIKQNQSWDNISLYKIANDIAWRNGMSLDYEPGAQNNPSYEHVEQSDASDLEFLKSYVMMPAWI